MQPWNLDIASALLNTAAGIGSGRSARQRACQKSGSWLAISMEKWGTSPDTATPSTQCDVRQSRRPKSAHGNEALVL
jgi:hypothetical protein